MGIIYEEKSRQFHLYNDKISYIMTCLPNGQMGQLYYGKRLRHRESFGHLLEFAHRDMAPCVYENDTTFSLEHIKQEYPGFGTGDMRYPAYGIRRENGSRVSCFVYKSSSSPPAVSVCASSVSFWDADAAFLTAKSVHTDADWNGLLRAVPLSQRAL